MTKHAHNDDRNAHFFYEVVPRRLSPADRSRARQAQASSVRARNRLRYSRVSLPRLRFLEGAE